MRNDFIKEISDKIAQRLPVDVNILKDDAQRHVQSAVQSVLQKMDLVTQEDYDVQQAVLLRTREKIQDLELRIKQLEEQLAQPQSQPALHKNQPDQLG